MTPVATRVVLIAGTCLLAGCSFAQRNVTTYKPSEPAQGIVLILNGAGGSTGASDTIASEVKKARAPLFVRSYDWSHGPGRAPADVTDTKHARIESLHFAKLISDYRTRFPDMPIYVMAHSAGAFVALEATRALPPDSIERMILLAPAVAADYDLRPALVAAKNVDSFSSERDGIFLGFGTSLFGTADGSRGVPPAGRVGFDPPSTYAALTARLHQHPWDSSVVWTGNNGGHDGALRPKYLRAYVLPLLNNSEMSAR